MQLKEDLQRMAVEIHDSIVANRRFLHQNPELSMNLPVTYEFVKSKLKEMGYSVQDCGPYGIVVLAGGKKPGKVFLLRADMDALPIVEETDLDFKSENGNMHACGHDMNTAMLLGAAEMLKKFEDKIDGTVKLMFQPGEETLLGAKSMIDHGLMENPSVDAAMNLHYGTGMGAPIGKVTLPLIGPILSSSDWFEIKIQGQGGHGAMPNTTIDPINVASHIYQSIQALNSRELPPEKVAVITVGKFSAGTTSNVIPDTAELQGTIRVFSPEMRSFIQARLKSISENTAKAFRAIAQVKIHEGCPPYITGKDLVKDVECFLTDLLDEDQLILPGSPHHLGRNMGSEDFGYISELVPSLLVGISGGNPEDGYKYPPHHPKARFDESTLSLGATIYSYVAIRWLENNK